MKTRIINTLLAIAASLTLAAADVQLPALVLTEDTAGSTDLTLGPEFAAGAAFQVHVTATPPELLRPADVLVGGTGTRRTVTVWPAADLSGTATVRITAGWNGFTQDFILPVRVIPAPEAPVIHPIPDQRMWVHARPQEVPVRITDVDRRVLGMSVSVLESSLSRVLPARLTRGIQPTNSIAFPVEALRERGWQLMKLTVNPGRPDVMETTFGILFTGGWMNPIMRPQSAPIAPINLIDSNGDGLVDVHPAFGGVRSPSVGLGLTTEPGRFGEWQAQGSGDFASTGTWADFDGDGRLDFVQPVPPDRLLVWFSDWRAGANTLFAVTNQISCVAGAQTVAADLDSDGDVDLLLSNPGPLATRSTLLLRNVGAGRFQQELAGFGDAAGTLDLADMDGDGNLDVLVVTPSVGSEEGALSLFLNDGTGRFKAGPAPLGQTPCARAGWVDADQDGRPELWTLRATWNANRLTNLLTLHTPVATGYSPVWTTWGTSTPITRRAPLSPVWRDFDNDGLVDVVGPGRLDGIDGWFLHRNLGGGRFEAITLIPGLPSTERFAAADVDRNGTLDLVFAQDRLLVITNGLPFPNLRPGQPTGLQAEHLGNSKIRFSWNAASDINQATALTYNLRVGTVPGGNQLVPSHSTTNGSRMIQAPGNMGFRRSVILDLSGREAETLHWSVQAVDATLVGGPFSEAALLRVPSTIRPPQILAPELVILDEDVPATFMVGVVDESSPIWSVVLKSDPSTTIGGRSSVLRVAPRGDTHRVQFIPDANWHGTTSLRLVATDPAGNSTTNSIRVEVRPVNDAPRFARTPSYLVARPGEPLPAFEVRFEDLDSPDSGISLSVNSSDDATLPASAYSAVLKAPGTLLISGTRLVPKQGSGTLTLRLADPMGADATVRIPFESSRRRYDDPIPLGIPAGRKVQFADVDADGDMDALVLSTEEEAVLVHRNRGAQGFEQEGPAVRGTITGFITGDVDGDGRVDLVATDSTPAIVVAANRDSGWVVTSRRPLPHHSIGTLVDLHDTGTAGFLFVTDSPGTPGALRYHIDGNTYEVVNLAEEVVRIEPGDWDADGRRDIAIESRTGWHFVHRRMGEEEWRITPLPWPVPDANASALARLSSGPEWVSTTNAGVPEIAVGSRPVTFFDPAPRRDPRRLPWHPVEPVLLPYQMPAEGPGWLAAAPGRPVRWIAHGRTDAGFALSAEAAGGDVAIVDIDGDGAVDLVHSTDGTAGDGTVPGLRWLRSRLAPDDAPTAPSGLVARTGHGGAVLSWNPGTKLGETYAIRLGTRPGGMDLIPALARTNGMRLIPTSSAAAPTPQRWIQGLKPGVRYYWSVQAVTAGGRGGPFSPEQSFEAPVAPVTIATESTLAVGREQSFADLILRGHLPTEASIEFEWVPAFLASRSPEILEASPSHRKIRVPLSAGWEGTATLRISAGTAAEFHQEYVAVQRGNAPVESTVLFRTVTWYEPDRTTPIRLGTFARPRDLRVLSNPVPTRGLLDSTDSNPTYLLAADAPLDGAETLRWPLEDPAGNRVFYETTLAPFPSPARLRHSARGGIDIVLAFPPGSTGLIEWTDDFTTWHPYIRYELNSRGFGVFEGIPTRDQPTRFFRITPTPTSGGNR